MEQLEHDEDELSQYLPEGHEFSTPKNISIRPYNNLMYILFHKFEGIEKEEF